MGPDKVLETITEELRTKHGCHTVILYGSRARGDATDISDYDILGVRESGPVFRDARLWNGAYLDIFLYSDKELLDPHDGMLDMRHGRILFQKGDFADRFFDRLEKLYQAGPKKLRADEIQALVVWHEKALARIRAGGIQGNLRQAELLPAILEHYFTIRGEWYPGPKASFQWLRENRPRLHQAFEKALEPGASISLLEQLVALVHADLAKESKPAPTTANEDGPKQPPVLHTNRLTVRMAQEKDIPAILQYFQENEARFASTDPLKPEGFYTEAFWSEILKNQRKAWASGQALYLFLFEAVNNRIAGTISFNQMFRGPFQACYLGYSLGGAHEGKGLMTEALGPAIQYIFEDLNFHRIMANHLPENERSARVLRRLGFEVEGKASNYLLINGQWRDHILNALTNQNWKFR